MKKTTNIKAITQKFANHCAAHGNFAWLVANTVDTEESHDELCRQELDICEMKKEYKLLSVYFKAQLHKLLHVILTKGNSMRGLEGTMPTWTSCKHYAINLLMLLRIVQYLLIIIIIGMGHKQFHFNNYLSNKKCLKFL